MSVRTLRSPCRTAPPVRRLRSAAAAALLLLAATAATPAAAAEDPPPAPGTADVLVLSDGRRLEGRVVAEDASGVTFRSAGTTRFHPSGTFERIDRGSAALAQGPDAPAPGSSPGTAGGDTPRSGSPGGSAPARRPAGAPASAPLSDAARKWLDELAARAGSADEQVRISIAAALQALGPSAVPSLRTAAEAAQDPAARSLLQRVADALSARPEAPAAAPTRPAPDAPRPASRTEGRKPGRGALFEKVASDLELREDQRPGFLRVLATLERESQGVLRLVRQEGLAPAEAAAQLEDLKTRTRKSAAEVLDAGQAEAFETVLGRYVDGQLDRAAKAARKPAPESPPEKP